MLAAVTMDFGTLRSYAGESATNAEIEAGVQMT
jgi:hypothetical protein